MTNAVDRFVPIQVSSIDDASAIRQVLAVSHGDGMVVRASQRISANGERLLRPEMWMVFEGGSTLHLSTEGSAYAPTVTQFAWEGHTLRLEEGDVTRCVYTSPSGEKRSFVGPATVRQVQPLSLADVEKSVDEALSWFSTGRHHPLVDEAFKTLEKLRPLGEKFDRFRQQVAGAATRVYALVVDKPIASGLGPMPEPRQIAEVIQEVRVRADGRVPATRHLPDQVSRTEKGSETLVPAGWEPPRVPCIKEWRYNGILADIQHACAGSEAACRVVGGSPFAPRTDCDSWCGSLGGADPVTFASYQISTLSCYRNSCVQSFDRQGSVQPLKNKDACMAGCRHESCYIWEPGVCEKKILNYQGLNYYICLEKPVGKDCGLLPTGSEYFFWPATSCPALGYSYYDAAKGNWRVAERNNADPGRHGHWGDMTASGPDAGVTSPGRDAGADGPGGTPTMDAPSGDDASCDAQWKPILTGVTEWSEASPQANVMRVGWTFTLANRVTTTVYYADGDISPRYYTYRLVARTASPTGCALDIMMLNSAIIEGSFNILSHNSGVLQIQMAGQAARTLRR